MEGHEAVVKLLLETGKIEVDMKDYGVRRRYWRRPGKGTRAWLSYCSRQVRLRLT
jgi:hypothetical protein